MSSNLIQEANYKQNDLIHYAFQLDISFKNQHIKDIYVCVYVLCVRNSILFIFD